MAVAMPVYFTSSVSLRQVKTDNERVSVQPDDHVKKFELPRSHLAREAFVRCIQESGIVKDGPTIHRLFDALTDHGNQMM